ncbi:hypothetical protein BDB01DRAFT_899501 [Pilobolus umbonatus]|nr:hypothetical protein BDB01DRAFT_899501 [Pilobolus umbonatus]
MLEVWNLASLRLFNTEGTSITNHLPSTAGSMESCESSIIHGNRKMINSLFGRPYSNRYPKVKILPLRISWLIKGVFDHLAVHGVITLDLIQSALGTEQLILEALNLEDLYYAANHRPIYLLLYSLELNFVKALLAIVKREVHRINLMEEATPSSPIIEAYYLMTHEYVCIAYV